MHIPSSSVLGLLRPCLALAGLALAACPGDPGEESDGACLEDVDTADVDAFFASIACTYAFAAEDQRRQGDATFTHGETYAIVVTADKEVTVATDGDPIVFAFDSGSGTFEDFDHETNVTVVGEARTLLMQYDKADGAITFIVGGGLTASWAFDATPPDPLPGPLDANDDHEDLGFAVGTFGGPIELRAGIDGTEGALALCTPISATITADGSATGTLDGTTFNFPFDASTTKLQQTDVGEDRRFRLAWETGTGADLRQLGVSFARLAGDTGAPTFTALSIKVVEGTFELESETYPRTVTYSTVVNSDTCPD